MTVFDPYAALALPAEAQVDRRVPKTLLIENGAFATGDRRRIREGIEQLRWLAALKPSTVGIATYGDSEREYLEIAILRLDLRTAAGGDRLVELVHRAVPYPVVLIVWKEGTPSISLAHKRRSLGGTGATLVDGEIITAWIDGDVSSESALAFRDSLALTCQPRDSLHGLYQGWIDCVQAFQAAEVTGAFSPPSSRVEAERRASALNELRTLDARIANVRAAAGKERQLACRAEMNLELARLCHQRDTVQAVVRKPNHEEDYGRRL